MMSIQHMAKNSWDLNFDFDLSIVDEYEDDGNAELKFDLYLTTRQIKQIADSLKNITLLPVTQQKKWVKQNKSYLLRMMDTFTSEVMDMFDEAELNQDALDESIACMSEFRQLMNTLNSLVGSNHRLRG